jgi:hypothetical protein
VDDLSPGLSIIEVFKQGSYLPCIHKILEYAMSNAYKKVGGLKLAIGS